MSNYRAHLLRILKRQFDEVDFLPEPFAVFQYYRYGVRHPLVTGQQRHVALVLDFGGGTFDVSVIETTAQGDISGSGRNSRPLAAASIPVGGYFINRVVAAALMRDNLLKGINKDEIGRALKMYDEYKNASIEDLEDLRSDYRNFIRHFKESVLSVEKAKIAICNMILSWDLDAEYKPMPAAQVRVPRSPMREEPEWLSARLDAVQLRRLFEERIWRDKLRPAIDEALSRAKAELEGKPINIVLLSGGSSNIRWLVNLLNRDVGPRLGDAAILELQENFQEIVAKGLAIECARRTFNSGNSEFRSVTYNRLCMGLDPDGRGYGAPRYKPITEKVPESKEDGVLLPSSSALQGFIGRPMSWKFRLKHPPRQYLDYYFMRSSLDPSGTTELHNVVDHRILTPANAGFDGQVYVELTVREDGTTIPKFIYRHAGPSSPEVAVEGRPFFMDMTYGSQASVGEAYLGFDFGTSNSSFSYVEREQVRTYTERAQEKNWVELNELVSTLPYPVAKPLARFLARTSQAELEKEGLASLEAFLTLAAYITYVDFCSSKGTKASRIFKGFAQASAGPLWALLKQSLDGVGKRSRLSSQYAKLFEEPLFTQIDEAISAGAQFKHGKQSKVDYPRVLSLVGNITRQVFSNLLFGYFEGVTKLPLRQEYSGTFRCARGPSSQFVEGYQYKGPHAFSDMEVFVIEPEAGRAIQLTPLYVWCSGGGASSDRQFYSYDIDRAQGYAFKGTDIARELLVDGEGELRPLFDMVKGLRTGDGEWSTLEGLSLQLPA